MAEHIDRGDVGSNDDESKVVNTEISKRARLKKFSFIQYLPDFALTDGLDSLFDATVDELLLHALLDQLDQFLAHLVAGQGVSNW